MSHPKIKKDLQSFLGIMNYLGKFSSVTAEVCEPLQDLAPVKAELTFNKSYQELYDQAIILIKKTHAWNFTIKEKY